MGVRKEIDAALAAMRDELAPHGFTVELDDANSGHPHLVATRAGARYRVPIARTPRVADSGAMYARQKARRILSGAWRPERSRA